MNYDVIIIGAGLGGLTAAATLAKQGKKVIVLEQHNIPGGCATVFSRKGVKYDVGLHEMDWGTPDRDMKALIFQKLGILECLPLVDLPQTWRVKTEKHEYTIPHGRKKVEKYLGGLFPQEKRRLKKYFFQMKASATLAGKLPNDMNLLNYFIYPFRTLPTIIWDLITRYTVGDKMDALFDTNRLRNILSINLPYYTTDAYNLSWNYYACAQYSYYHGAVYIKGGGQTLSNLLVKVITDHGGEVRLNSDVTKIILDGKKAVGVEYRDKKTKESVEVLAKKIIANIDPANIFDGNMVPQHFEEKSTKGRTLGSSLYSIYITFKTPPSKVYDDLSYSTFITSEDLLDGTQQDIAHNLTNEDINKRSFVFVDYSVIDSGLVELGDTRSFGTICSSSSLSEWENLTDKEYKEKKQLLAQSVIKRLEVHYPGITDLIERYEVSTPKTIKRYLRTSEGTPYGYMNKGYPMVDLLPRRSKAIKNLHYTGAFTFPGGGFTGVIVSGYYTANDLIFPMKYRIILNTLACILVGYGIAQILAFIFSYA